MSKRYHKQCQGLLMQRYDNVYLHFINRSLPVYGNDVSRDNMRKLFLENFPKYCVALYDDKPYLEVNPYDDIVVCEAIEILDKTLFNADSYPKVEVMYHNEYSDKGNEVYLFIDLFDSTDDMFRYKLYHTYSLVFLSEEGFSLCSKMSKDELMSIFATASNEYRDKYLEHMEFEEDYLSCDDEDEPYADE